MHRDLDQLTRQTFDVLVVGGGVYGLTIACDAAQRGLSVALVDRRDFGSGSSFNHLRTIHGGLRYLQTLDLRRARESVLERRTLARIAPGYVQPLAFVLPLTRSVTRGRMAMRAGFLLDRWVASDRNEGIPASHHLAPGHVVDRDRAIERYPILRSVAMTGAAVWQDYVTVQADRLTLAWGLAAVQAGAILANYVEAQEIRTGADRAASVRALDHRQSRTFDIATRLVVNATGAAVDRLVGSGRAAPRLPMLKAMNLVTRREAPPVAVGGRSRSGRNLFLVPWKGRALFGTWESTRPADPGDDTARRQEVDAFVSEINHAFPGFDLGAADIALVHRGIVPAVPGPDGTLLLDGGEHIHDHAAAGLPAVVSVVGTKYTTARAVAERATDLIVEKLGRQANPCRTSSTPLPFSELRGDDLLVMSAREEMVETLEDAVVRRTGLGALGYPGESVVRQTAEIVGSVLGWDGRRKDEECDRVRRFYAIDDGVTAAGTR